MHYYNLGHGDGLFLQPCINIFKALSSALDSRYRFKTCQIYSDKGQVLTDKILFSVVCDYTCRYMEVDHIHRVKR